MTECIAEKSYLLNDAQRQRLGLEVLLGEPSPSWIIVGAVIHGVTNLARFHDALLDLARVYPVLRTTLVTAGPAESWSQHIRNCHDIWRGRPPVVHVPAANSWTDLTEAMHEDLAGRNPDYRYSAAYGIDRDGRLRIVFSFDHVVFDLKSVDILLAYLAGSASGDEMYDYAGPCRCGGNEFMNYVEKTDVIADRPHLPERYEWALELMLAASSPHAYVSLPVATPMSIVAAGDVTGFRSRFVTDARSRHSYTPFAAFASALTLSLEVNFESPAMFYTPTLNREPSEMASVGWFAGTPIMPVRSTQIMSAVAAERVLDDVQATSEVMAATTQTMQDGQLLTNLIYRRVSAALGGRMPFIDCLPDSLPYIVVGYVDRVRERVEWKAKNVIIRRARLPGAAYPRTLVPPGYLLIRLLREKKAEWSVEAVYEAERYDSGIIGTLMSSMERYLRQLLG